VEGSEKASDFTRLRSELATLDSEVRTVETRILNAIGPLKRVFKKYQKAAETGKYPPGNVAAYIADPTGTFLKGDERLGDLLKNLRKAIEDDGLGLDKNESEKSLRRLDGIGLEALEKLRKEHKAFLEARAELERKLAHLDVTKEVKEFKRVLGGVEERLKDTKSAGEHLEKEIEALENDLEKGLSDIEKTLDIKIIRPPAS